MTKNTLTESKTLWLTGLSGAGKSTLAEALVSVFRNHAQPCVILDGDEIRKELNNDLGFSDDDRKENIRRVSVLAKLLQSQGITVIVALISPFREDRDKARQHIGAANFVEIFCDCPLEVCQERDPKKLYLKASEGKVKQMTGLSSPYEAPESPDIHIKTSELSIDEGVKLVTTYLGITE